MSKPRTSLKAALRQSVIGAYRARGRGKNNLWLVSSVSQFRSKNTSVFKLNTYLDVGFHDFDMIKSQKALAHIWLTRFFLILNRIEMQLDKESFDINRWDNLMFDDIDSASCEFTPESKSQPRAKATGQWIILYPQAEFLAKRGEVRCENKLDVNSLTPDMYKSWLTFTFKL